LSSEQAVRNYKSLSGVERAFRSLKTVDLHVRPIHHRQPDRVRAHIFLCMLAYYVEWHMRKNLAPLLFDDEDKLAAEQLRASVVAPAQRSPSAQAKAHTRRTPEDLPVHSFQTLLGDLATIVSKYIGETEKNLDRIFNAAEGSNAILFFDEADALFGKRSEVKDARDRYANVEVAYLLQRMERFDGVAILTTNLRSNLDEAFTRRLDAVVDFPVPDEADRLRLWERHLPAGVPRDADLDLPFLARRFRLSGGNVRNICLAAAFLAAAEDRALRMSDLIHGTAREYQKLGRLCVEAEFGPWYGLVRG